MEIAVLSNHLFHHALSSNHLSVAGNLHISALLSAIDAVAPPPVRSPRAATATLRKRRLSRTRKRRRSTSDGSDDGDGSFDGGCDDGPFGGGGGGGGGGGWNFDGFGAFGWDDSSSSPADPAFDFVYEVICWLVLSNCVHFAYKRVVRLVSDHGREKVPMRIASVC